MGITMPCTEFEFWRTREGTSMAWGLNYREPEVHHYYGKRNPETGEYENVCPLHTVEQRLRWNGDRRMNKGRTRENWTPNGVEAYFAIRHNVTDACPVDEHGEKLCKFNTPRYYRTKHVGAVLADRERNYHDDSDFYAVYWDFEDGAPSTIEYATTRFGGGGSCKVDATDEVRALYEAYQAEAYRRAKYNREQGEREQDRRDALLPTVGDRVRVIRKLKRVAKGTEGVIFWEGTCSYNGSTRFGIKDADGEKHWVGIKSVELTEPEKVQARSDAMPEPEELLPSFRIERDGTVVDKPGTICRSLGPRASGAWFL